jgi:hypothetical protein
MLFTATDRAEPGAHGWLPTGAVMLNYHAVCLNGTIGTRYKELAITIANRPAE